MSKFFLPLSLSLVASTFVSSNIASAELIPNDTTVNNQQSSCIEVAQKTSPPNINVGQHIYPRQRIELAEAIIDFRPSYDPDCGDYYTTIKYGQTYECIQCTYGGPYCWEKH